MAPRLDLLNDFWLKAEKDSDYAPYRKLIRRARPYSLDWDATQLITELSSGPTIGDKIAIYRKLARLPFDDIWIEFPYDARFEKRKALGTTEIDERPEEAPDRMGWLIQRMSDTSWRAVTISRYTDGDGNTQVDPFLVTHLVSTDGPVEFRSHVREPVLREVVEDAYRAGLAAGFMWGFGKKSHNGVVQIPSHLHKTNAVDFETVTETRLSKIKDKKKRYDTALGCLEAASTELRGDLRFLVAALAVINETPITTHDSQPLGKARVGGGLRPYMINRVVSINLPKTKGRTRKVMAGLRLAERAMRRHEVSGHWKNVKRDGVVERKWINTYERGDASLGFVRQIREVKA